jgi:CheY-like chemotaxis protein
MAAHERLILLVEDSADDVFLFKRTLATVRFKNPVQAVPHVDEAIRYLEGAGQYADRSLFPLPSIVIIDLHLPEKDGFHLLSWLRDRPEFADLHIVAVSGVNRLRDINLAYQLGASTFLTKPIREDDLRNLAHSCLAHWA